MVIDIKKLLKEGKLISGFCFVVPKEEGIIPIPGVEFDGDITVSGEVEIVGKDVYVDAEISYGLKGECSRCGREATDRVVQPINVKFVLSNPQEDDYCYNSGLVDLSVPVREFLLAGFPYVLLCKEDCKGLCPVCGQNLNEDKCNCER